MVMSAVSFICVLHMLSLGTPVSLYRWKTWRSINSFSLSQQLIWHPGCSAHFLMASLCRTDTEASCSVGHPLTENKCRSSNHCNTQKTKIQLCSKHIKCKSAERSHPQFPRNWLVHFKCHFKVSEKWIKCESEVLSVNTDKVAAHRW